VSATVANTSGKGDDQAPDELPWTLMQFNGSIRAGTSVVKFMIILRLTLIAYIQKKTRPESFI
jgi:hypothetical protein